LAIKQHPPTRLITGIDGKVSRLPNQINYTSSKERWKQRDKEKYKIQKRERYKGDEEEPKNINEQQKVKENKVEFYGGYDGAAIMAQDQKYGKFTTWRM